MTTTNLTVSSIERIDPNDLIATDLREHAATPTSDDLRAYRVRFEQDGKECAEAADALYFPTAQRAGIAWGGDAVWTDADGIKDALRRYCADEMIA